MHGRIKVRSTAEQQEAKRKEQQKKAEHYTSALEKIFSRRRAGVYDKEALALTGAVLATNPDVVTLWNYRRQILEQLRAGDAATSQLDQLCAEELKFSEECLRVNPKSYSSWHQREWLGRFWPAMDWASELQLCNKYLEYDERNFHCWDYRRYVVRMAQVPPERELQFTTTKIQSNFSNFSSWHYRSKLLPQLHPSPDSCTRVAQDVLSEEIELVKSAFFTDPSDQSAWFYYRWLLSQLTPGPAREACLREELAALEELRELEEDNKWVLLTLVHLLALLGENSDVHLRRLLLVEPVRTRYYSDLLLGTPAA